MKVTVVFIVDDILLNPNRFDAKKALNTQQSQP